MAVLTRIPLLICATFGLASAVAAAAQTRPATAPADPVATAVAALVEEANDAFREQTTRQITVYRPHPAVKDLDRKQVHQVLHAITAKKLTGNDYKDTYVRYHMMWVVNQALDETKEPFIRELMKLAEQVPEDPKIELKPWYTYEPLEIAQRYFQLMSMTYAAVGFPPFGRQASPPESFQYMDGPRRAQAQAAWAEAKTLEGKFKQVTSPENHAYNQRVSWINWIVRQYRGELFYALIAQGDDKALDRIVGAICAAASKNPVRATDLISFFNVAYMDGLLSRYSADELKQSAQRLKQAAIEYETAARKGIKNQKAATMSVGWINHGGRWRHLPESLFTVVFGIENNLVPPRVPVAERSRPEPQNLPPARPKEKPVTPQEVDLEMVDAAIARGLVALEKMFPPDVDLGPASWQAKGLAHGYVDLTMPGQGALMTWAMLACGESHQTTWMQRHINWVMCYDSPNTYDRVMRLMVLGELPRQKYSPWIRRDSNWLVDTAGTQGNWESYNVGQRSSGLGDNANGQYALLGLWSAAEQGSEIPAALWQRVDNYWRNAQRPPGAPGEGAWAVASSASVTANTNLKDFSQQVSAPMTAGGVLSLYLTEGVLFGGKRVDVGQSFSPQLLRGIQWLDDNFSLEKLDGDFDFYFYAWTIQNVGQATGYRTFNDVDWFRGSLARLISQQGPDGAWHGPKGPHVSTSFALLYLQRARGPLAICKVRFDPTATPGKPLTKTQQKKGPTRKELQRQNSWNNRPNDMYNFVTDVGRRMEVPTNWQIADLDQPLYELAESQLLYLATDKKFKLPGEQVQRLKEYIDAGGLLVCVPEGGSASAPLASMKALAAELCPGVEPARETDFAHPFYSLVTKVEENIPMTIYATPVRPRVVVIERDLGRDLQANQRKERDAFNLLTNIYLYVAGKDARRPRIAANFIPLRNEKPAQKVAAARVVLAKGEPDLEPMALPQVKALLANRHNVDVVLSESSPAELSASTKLAFLPVTASTTLSDEQAKALRAWSDAGGTLWLDAVGGSPDALKNLDVIVGQLGLGPGELQPAAKTWLTTGETIATGYDTAGVQTYRAFTHPGGRRPTVSAKFAGDRAAVVVVRGDLTCGLVGLNHWGIAGLTPKAARQIVANGVLSYLPRVPAATQPTTKPSTRPATQPATQPATAAAAAVR